MYIPCTQETPSVIDKQCPTKDLGNLKEVFSLFNAKGAGFISSRDLCICFRSLGYNPTEAECQDLINEVSPDRDGHP